MRTKEGFGVMKVFSGNSVFVQKDDLFHLIRYGEGDIEIPRTIISQLTSSGAFVVTSQDKYDFVEFKELPEISFFQSLDWIIDYHAVKDYSNEELIELGKRTAEEKNGTAICFNSMTYEEQQQHSDLVRRCNFLEFKMYSIRDFLWFKQGHIKMDLPEGVDYPAGLKQEKGVRGFVKSVINKWKKA